MRPKRTDDKYWIGTRDFNHIRYERDLEDYIIDLENETQKLRKHVVSEQSEQLVCDCGNSIMTWYGNDDDKKWFCFNCKKEADVVGRSEQMCECKKHSIKTNYGFEICTKCGNEFDD